MSVVSKETSSARLTAADRFRGRREALGLLQWQMGHAMHVCKQTIGRWERGETRIPARAWRWLDALEHEQARTRQS